MNGTCEMRPVGRRVVIRKVSLSGGLSSPARALPFRGLIPHNRIGSLVNEKSHASRELAKGVCR